MSRLETSIKRLKQRSKLPAGDKIDIISCQRCGTSIWVWCNDKKLAYIHHTHILCTYCRAAERAENAAIFGRKS